MWHHKGLIPRADSTTTKDDKKLRVDFSHFWGVQWQARYAIYSQKMYRFFCGVGDLSKTLMSHEVDWPSNKKVILVHFVKIQLQASSRFSCQSQQNSCLGDLTKLKKRHRQPLKTTFNSGVLQNPTSGKTRRAGREEEGPEMYNGNYSSYGPSSCLPVVENHPGDRTAASALRHWRLLPPKN